MLINEGRMSIYWYIYEGWYVYTCESSLTCIKTYEYDIMYTRGAEAKKGISRFCVQFLSMHCHHIIRFTKPLPIIDLFYQCMRIVHQTAYNCV